MQELVLQSNSYFDLNIGKVVDSFAVKEKRRLGFLFITSDDIYDQNRLLGTEELWVHVLTDTNLFLTQYH
jgi:hypothetical protein